MKPAPPRISLRSQVMAAVLAAGLLPLLLFVLSAQFITRRTLMREELEKIGLLVREAGRQVQRCMARAAADLRVLAANPVLHAPAATGETVLREMKKIQEYYGLFADITLYDLRGGVLLSTTHSYWESIEHTAWFKQAAAGRVALSSPSRIVGMEGLFLTLYAPVGDDARHPGQILAARIPFDRVSDPLHETLLGQTGYFVLLDVHGNILAHPDAARVLQRFDPDLPQGYWQNQPQGRYAPAGGPTYSYVAHRLDPESTGVSPGWILIGFRPHRETLAPLQQQFVVLGGISLLTLGAVYLMSVFYSRRLARPLIEVASAAQQVARGEGRVTIPEKGAWEIQQLAGAFNQMVREVQRHRQSLETLVEQRTGRLRESEQQLARISAHLRAAYETVMDGMLLIEAPGGRVISANSRFAEFFDLADQPLAGLSSEQLALLLRPRLARPAGDLFHARAFQEHPEQVDIEEWELAPPRRLTLSVYSAPASGADGRPVARLWIFRDLTCQRQLEDELRQAQKMEAIGRLAGGIAHDFNNLLTGILGNLSMAEIDLPPHSGLRQYLQPARQAAHRAAELINQLLGFSRRSRLQIHPCSCNSVIREVHALLRHSVDPRIEIRLELQDELWPVSGDATQLQQVLMNLCVNAADAMPRGGRLSLHTRNTVVDREEARQGLDAREGDFVRVCVQDNGLGMSLEVQQHLFEPFFTTKEPGKGTGLGLAMSYGIIRQHGGWITCASELNRGTTFCLYIPRAAGAAAETAPAPEPQVRGGAERVLVIDDEESIRDVAAMILRRYGYTVDLAGDGEEALARVDDATPDLIVLDLTMPRLSGQETFRALRLRAPGVPIMISSGYVVDTAHFESDSQRPPEAFVKKPYEARTLARAVRELLDRERRGPRRL